MALDGGDQRRGDPFAAAVRHSQMAMVVVDARAPGQPIISANPAFSTLTGYPEEEVLGRNCRFMQGPDTDPLHRDALRAAIDEGRSISVEILNYKKDGRAFWNGLYVSPVRDEDGAITHFFGAQLDVSEKKAWEQALIRAKSGLESAVEARTAALSDALAQKTALLHEVDHRVKNNLQLIASLIMLQSRRTRDPAAQGALRGVLDRVGAISTAHRQLFQAADVDRFEALDFLAELAADRDVAFEAADGAAARIDAAQAAPLALLVNEILSHAAERQGRMKVTRTDAGALRVCVEGPPALTADESFSREIVSLMARQLQGTAGLERTGGDSVGWLELPLAADA